MRDKTAKRRRAEELTGNQLLLWQAIKFQLLEHNHVRVSSLGAVFKTINKLKRTRIITLAKRDIHAHCFKMKPTVLIHSNMFGIVAEIQTNHTKV